MCVHCSAGRCVGRRRGRLAAAAARAAAASRGEEERHEEERAGDEGALDAAQRGLVQHHVPPALRSAEQDQQQQARDLLGPASAGRALQLQPDQQSQACHVTCSTTKPRPWPWFRFCSEVSRIEIRLCVSCIRTHVVVEPLRMRGLLKEFCAGSLSNANVPACGR